MNGIVQDEPAINRWWSLPRPAVLYVPIPKLSEDQLSAIEEEETWLKRSHHFQSELRWLLSLDHHRFWSQVVYNPGTMDGLVSFLQEALPYYALPEFLVGPRLEEGYHETARLVFLVFVRLGTIEPAAKHYLPEEKQAELIYDNHIFTLPIILDICHLFGRENKLAIGQLVANVFQIQPRYLNDIPQMVSFLEEALKILTHSFCGAAAIRSVSGEPTPLVMGNDQMLLADMTPGQCRDKLLYLLDTTATAAAFLDAYSPATKIFRCRHFHSRLAVFYHDAVPQIEKKIESIGANDERISQYVDLKHKLSLAKMEMLGLFKHISTSTIHHLLENRSNMSEEELKQEVDEYLTMLTDCLTERVFMQDYHNVYGVEGDLDTVAQLSSDMDIIKYDYLMESVMSTLDPPPRQRIRSAPVFRAGICGGSSFRENGCVSSDNAEPSTSGTTNTSCKSVSQLTGVELESLISQVRDLLPDLGDGFVQRCLEHFDYRSDAVINGVLEDSLPAHLKALDRQLPRITDDPDEEAKRLNVFDNDEFDIMTRDVVDTSRIHQGKRRTVPKNVFELLNDKSDVKAFREMYQRFGTLDTTGSMYEDEYDDTYDNDVAIDEAGDSEKRRRFVVPRVLQTKEDASEEEESDDDQNESESKQPRDAFCENPADVRARRERQRAEKMQQRGAASGRGGGRGGGTGRGGNHDLVGKPKGQGQDKQVLVNRDKKNANKSSRGNHHRRSGAQHKRNQGMIPS